MKMFLMLVLSAALMHGQPVPPPPAPPPPPAFMGMKGFPLACFAKPTFEDDGLEFFVCNGGAGLAGVRKKADPKHIVFVSDPAMANNMNMKAAKLQCTGRFGVSMDGDGTVYFLCSGKHMDLPDRFRTASAADWRKYLKYLDK